MMKPYREYEWEWELEDDTPCVVEAMVTGKQHRGFFNACDHRSVSISVYTRFCPSADDRDGCKGCEREDVTEKCSKELIERLTDMALERDNEAQEDHR